MLGPTASLFQFVNFPLSAEDYFRELARRKTQSLAHTSYGPHFIPALRNNDIRVDDNPTLRDAVTTLSGALDEVESGSLKEAASLAHHGRRGVALAAMARLLNSVVMREVPLQNSPSRRQLHEGPRLRQQLRLFLTPDHVTRRVTTFEILRPVFD